MTKLTNEKLIVHLPYVTLLGKKWFVYNESITLQCAYCLSVQDRKILRDDNGLVIGVKIVLPENHSSNCYQNSKTE